MLSMQEFRSRAQGLPDLLPYAALIAPGVVLCKDGSLLAGWEYQGQDVASSTADELEFLSDKVNAALLLLGSGWMLHVDAIRQREAAYQPDGCFPDPVSKRIDDERRTFFSGRHCLRTITRLCVSYKPDYGQDRLAHMATSGLASYNAVEKSLSAFQTALDSMQDALSAVLHLQRLDEYDLDGGTYSALLSHLHQVSTGQEQPVRLPASPMYLDALIGGTELMGGTAPKLGEQWLGVISIDGLPQQSSPAMFDALDSLPFPYRFSTRYICLDQAQALKAIDVYRRTWQQKLFRFLDTFFNNPSARPNRDAARMVEDAEEAIAEVQSGMVGAGYLSTTLVLLDEEQDRLTERCRDVRKLLQALGFGCRIEHINALEAWLGSLPGNGYANIRRPLVHTLNVADLLPLTAAWGGLELNPNPLYPAHSPALIRCLTDGTTPFWFTPWTSDMGHTFIVGPPGSGKSTLLVLMAAQFFRYRGAQLFAFDKGGSLYALCKGMGGRHYDVGKDLSFAPLRGVDQESERLWAVDWLVGLARLQGLEVQPMHRNALHTAVASLAAQPEAMRTLTDLWNLLQDPDGNLKAALRPYTADGGTDILDAEEDGFGVSSMMVFELEDLMNRDASITVPVLLYLFHRLEASMTGRPTALLLDEAWIMLGHDLFKNKIREWLKVLRKKVCGVWMATQSLSDAANSGIWDVLMESCQNKVLLPNSAAKQQGSRELYQSLGLNAVELELISAAIPKRDYYFIHPNGRRLFQLALGKVTLAFVGVSDPNSIARVKELEATYGPDGWQERWIEERAGVKIEIKV